MILNRPKICIVFILGLLNVLTAMEASVCKAPVPKQFMTTSSRCLTFRKFKGVNSKLSVDLCDETDQNQLVYVTKMSKTEAVFHNYDNNRLICYDSCREKFVTVDREEIEKDVHKQKLRRRLNKLLQKEERLLQKARRRGFYQKDHRLPVKERRKLRRKQKDFEREFRKLLHKRQNVELRLYPAPRTMCASEAAHIKNLSGHHPRIRHCSSKERPANHLFCTLHETMDDTGHTNIYASLPGATDAFVIVNKRQSVRALKIHQSQNKIMGQFLVNSVSSR